MVRLAVAAASVWAVGGVAGAKPMLRISTMAPEGSVWSRELRAWAEDLERHSADGLGVKMYFGGIAGDELEVGDRIRRGQLEGVISHGSLCQQVAPSMRVMKVPGIFMSRDEAIFVMHQLKPRIDEEARAHGFVNMAEGTVGPIIVFSRRPITTMAELRKTNLWTGRQEDTMIAGLEAMGLHAVPGKMDAAADAFATGKIDGFLTVPSVALTWQWTKLAPHYTDLRIGFLYSCLLISERAFDALPLDMQSLVRAAAAQLLVKSEQQGRQQEETLMGGLFEKQGVMRTPVDERLRAEFFEAVQASREKIDPQLVPPALLHQVLGLLADFRARPRAPAK
jgi:TRAP-type C4-dicarboxylate transport system substrate-binding protein